MHVDLAYLYTHGGDDPLDPCKALQDEVDRMQLEAMTRDVEELPVHLPDCFSLGRLEVNQRQTANCRRPIDRDVSFNGIPATTDARVGTGVDTFPEPAHVVPQSYTTRVIQRHFLSIFNDTYSHPAYPMGVSPALIGSPLVGASAPPVNPRHAASLAGRNAAATKTINQNEYHLLNAVVAPTIHTTPDTTALGSSPEAAVVTGINTSFSHHTMPVAPTRRPIPPPVPRSPRIPSEPAHLQSLYPSGISIARTFRKPHHSVMTQAHRPAMKQGVGPPQYHDTGKSPHNPTKRSSSDIEHEGDPLQGIEQSLAGPQFKKAKFEPKKEHQADHFPGQFQDKLIPKQEIKPEHPTSMLLPEPLFHGDGPDVTSAYAGDIGKQSPHKRERCNNDAVAAPSQPCSPQKAPSLEPRRKVRCKSTYPCVLCERTFTRGHDLRRHLRTKHPSGQETYWRSPVCHTRFPRRDAALRHLNMVHLDAEMRKEEVEKYGPGIEDPWLHIDVQGEKRSKHSRKCFWAREKKGNRDKKSDDQGKEKGHDKLADGRMC